jgi:hypothetical protein
VLASEEGPRVNPLLGITQSLGRLIRTILGTFEKWEVKLDRLLLDLDNLATVQRRGAASVPMHRPGRRSAEILRAQAAAGVSRLQIRPRADGRFDVGIGDGKPMTVNRALADLLTVISAEAESTDHLVGWKTYDHVTAALGKPTGNRLTKGALNERIRKLRETFAAAGINPFLVITHREKGVRFALQRTLGASDVADQGR